MHAIGTFHDETEDYHAYKVNIKNRKIVIKENKDPAVIGQAKKMDK